MIVLWGLPRDRPLAAVHEALLAMRQPCLFLDQTNVLSTEVEFAVGHKLSGTLWYRDCTVDLATVRAVYLRPYDTRQLPAVAHLSPDDADYRRAIEVEDALISWTDMAPGLVVNRTAAMASNNSKPYQARLIRAGGFNTPDTLITTDPAAARSFWQEHGAVIYKSVSGVRSIVARLAEEDEARLQDVTWCPVQFQEYVPGDDYRVHVVGDQLFACRITSGATDYRYAERQGASVSMEACRLPDDVAERCRQLTAALQLSVTGLDLRRTPDGRWYCFEVNPSPGFTYFEQETGAPIAEAVARLLAYAGGA